jgi:SH3-like domain-containing protein
MKLRYLLLSSVAATVAAFGMALPSFARPATLMAQSSSSPINVRSTPSTTASSPHYGYAGDRVEVLRSVIGQDEYSWNYVRFQSGAQGWVRGDFVRYSEGMAQYGVLGGRAGDRINVRMSPSIYADSPHYGVEGDVVQLVTQTQGRDGYMWRFVQFPSGAQGWVRGDLVQLADVGGC